MRLDQSRVDTAAAWTIAHQQLSEIVLSFIPSNKVSR